MPGCWEKVHVFHIWLQSNDCMNNLCCNNNNKRVQSLNIFLVSRQIMVKIKKKWKRVPTLKLHIQVCLFLTNRYQKWTKKIHVKHFYSISVVFIWFFFVFSLFSPYIRYHSIIYGNCDTWTWYFDIQMSVWIIFWRTEMLFYWNVYDTLSEIDSSENPLKLHLFSNNVFSQNILLNLGIVICFTSCKINKMEMNIFAFGLKIFFM